MKKRMVLLFLYGMFLLYPVVCKAEVILPCHTVLEPVGGADMNAKGSALIYKVKLSPSFPRTSISIHALHLPAPSAGGDYDGYEGFATITNEISWRFKLYPTPEEGGPTWAGRFDEITADLANSNIEVRLSNSKTGKLGPAILSSQFNACK